MSGVSVACKGLSPSTVIIGAEVFYSSFIISTFFFFSIFFFQTPHIHFSQFWLVMLHYLFKKGKGSPPFQPQVRQVCPYLINFFFFSYFKNDILFSGGWVANRPRKIHIPSTPEKCFRFLFLLNIFFVLLINSSLSHRNHYCF